MCSPESYNSECLVCADYNTRVKIGGIVTAHFIGSQNCSDWLIIVKTAFYGNGLFPIIRCTQCLQEKTIHTNMKTLIKQ